MFVVLDSLVCYFQPYLLKTLKAHGEDGRGLETTFVFIILPGVQAQVNVSL